MPKRHNILYLHSHDTGRFVQPYGHPVPTPHIQRFAEEGMVFRQAFCASPGCSPSRAALLTGQYPHSCGMHGLASTPWQYRLDDPRKLLMNTLASAGYTTALAGVQHLSANRPDLLRQQGYQIFLNEDRLGEDVPDLHERVAGFFAGGPASPWFLSVGFDQTHRDNRQGDPASGTGFSKPSPYDIGRLDDRYCLPPPTCPDLPETRRDMASFREGARRLDERIGRVLGALEASGRAGDTLVLLTTDHGAAWPGMKCNLTDLGLGVMMILRGPGGFSSGRVSDAMVTHLDVFPTLCELLGLNRPAWIEGKSLLPLVRGGADRLHDEIFAEMCWHEVAEPQRSVRTPRHKYVRRFDLVGPKAANADEGPTKRCLQSAGFFDRVLGGELLFDLMLDPLEMCNRAADPACSEPLARLRRALDGWMRRTDDPLLRGGPVPPPGGGG